MYMEIASGMAAAQRRLMHIGLGVAGRGRSQATAKSTAGSVVQLEQRAADSVVTVKIDGSPFVTYCYGSELARPFLFPVHGPRGGPVLTRPHQPDNGEHPRQKGVWCAVDEVNGIRFWGERQIPANVERWPQVRRTHTHSSFIFPRTLNKSACPLGKN